jgi:anaerobic magnesium-protoporphyrin IX monomethyl ester cyclase
MLKVTLINPPQDTNYPQPPLGLALLAAILEKQGYSPLILDANVPGFDLKQAIRIIDSSSIVGITAMTPTIGKALAIAKQVKQSKPGTTIILGGPHVTLMPEETLASTPYVDIVARGEGDDTIIELMKALENKESIGTISGISFIHDGKAFHNPERKALTDIEGLPYPAFHLLDLKSYRPHPPHGMYTPFAAMVTSRGCPYRCAYCSKPVFGSKFRAQSGARVVAEMTYLKEKFGVKEIAFYDDSFTIDKKRIHEMCDLIIEKKLKIAWTCETRVNLVDKELLQHMKQAGCYAIAYGIETAAPEIMKVIQKDITLEEVEKAVRAHHEIGLKVVGYFMIGSPGETPETIMQTVNFAKKLKVDFAQFSITTPFPATELYDIYMQGRKEPPKWEDFVYVGTDNLATPVFESDKLTREDLKTWASKAYRMFYLRPGYIWQRVKRCTSWAEIKTSIKGLQMLLHSI